MNANNFVSIFYRFAAHADIFYGRKTLRIKYFILIVSCTNEFLNCISKVIWKNCIFMIKSAYIEKKNRSSKSKDYLADRLTLFT